MTLLIIRYICTAPDGVREHYPNSPFKPGEILTREWALYSGGDTEWTLYNESVSESISESEAVKYPHLFRKLEWWEFRKLEDMPAYVKLSSGEVYKVTNKWDESKRIKGVFWTLLQNGSSAWQQFAPGCSPATEEEYLAYQNREK